MFGESFRCYGAMRLGPSFIAQTLYAVRLGSSLFHSVPCAAEVSYVLQPLPSADSAGLKTV